MSDRLSPEDLELQRRANAIFDEVAEAPEAEHEALLRASCCDDLQLRGLVEKLLASDRDPSAFDRLQRIVASEGPAPAQRLVPGEEVGPWRVERLVGSGGFAQVWRVQRGAQVRALKVLIWADPTMRRRLLREAETQKDLDHRNIVPVEQILDVRGSPGLLMPLVLGPPLHALMAETLLPYEELVGLFRGIVEGVRYVHDKGLAHRDLKPGNVLLDLQQGGVVPRITDFGLVKAEDWSRHTKTGSVVGTLGYCAPEQLHDSSKVGPAADLWALGVLLFELASGRTCFPGRTLESLERAHRAGPPVGALPQHAWPLAPLVEALLDRDPARRPDCAAVLERLPLGGSLGPESQAWGVCARLVEADAIPVSAPTGGDTDPLEDVVRRPARGGWFVAAVALVTAAAAGAWALWQPDRPSKDFDPPSAEVEPQPSPPPEPVEDPLVEEPLVEPVVEEPAPQQPRPALALEAPPGIEPEPVEEPVVEEPVVEPATVRVRGTTRATRLVSGDGRVLPVGQVPPGRYQFEARLEEFGQWVQLDLEVAAGQVVDIKCDELFSVCVVQ